MDIRVFNILKEGKHVMIQVLNFIKDTYIAIIKKFPTLQIFPTTLVSNILDMRQQNVEKMIA